MKRNLIIYSFSLHFFIILNQEKVFEKRSLFFGLSIKEFFNFISYGRNKNWFISVQLVIFYLFSFLCVIVKKSYYILKDSLTSVGMRMKVTKRSAIVK